MTQKRTVSQPAVFIPLTLLCSQLEISALYKFYFFQTQHHMKRLVHLFMQQRGNASPKPPPANSVAKPSDSLSSYPPREHPASQTPFKISRLPYNDNVHRHKLWLNKETRKQDIMKSCHVLHIKTLYKRNGFLTTKCHAKLRTAFYSP